MSPSTLSCSKHTMAFYWPREWSPTSSAGLRKSLIWKTINRLEICQPKTADFIRVFQLLVHTHPHTKAHGYGRGSGQTHPTFHTSPYLLSVSCVGKETSCLSESCWPHNWPHRSYRHSECSLAAISASSQKYMNIPLPLLLPGHFCPPQPQQQNLRISCWGVSC